MSGGRVVLLAADMADARRGGAQEGVTQVAVVAPRSPNEGRGWIADRMEFTERVRAHPKMLDLCRVAAPCLVIRRRDESS